MGEQDGAALAHPWRRREAADAQANRGVSAARNAGLRRASGDAIAFQDSDDLWPSGRLAALAKALGSDESADIVAGRVQMLDERTEKPRSRENLETLHRLHNMPSLLIKRSVFDRVGHFNEGLRVAEDTEFVMRVRRHGITFKLIDEIAMLYRLHGGNISADIDRNQASAMEVFRALSLLRRRPQ